MFALLPSLTFVDMAMQNLAALQKEIRTEDYRPRKGVSLQHVPMSLAVLISSFLILSNLNPAACYLYRDGTISTWFQSCQSVLAT